MGKHRQHMSHACINKSKGQGPFSSNRAHRPKIEYWVTVGVGGPLGQLNMYELYDEMFCFCLMYVLYWFHVISEVHKAHTC